MRSAFALPQIGNLQFVWWGWRRWTPLAGLDVIRPPHPMAIVWRWCLFLGPLEIRCWVPRRPRDGRGTP